MQIRNPNNESGLAKYPEAVHLVIVKTPDGRYNPMSASWVMFTSLEPRMIAVSIGFQRYTYELIRSAGAFVIATPSDTMAEEVAFFGSNSGRDMDKLKELGTAVQPASEIDCILLSDACLNYECIVDDSVKSGDHMIFTGTIVATHLNEKPQNRLFVQRPKTFGGLKPV